jgi:hypothetical protein
MMNDSLFVLCRTIIPWRKVAHFDPSQGFNMNFAPNLSFLATKLAQIKKKAGMSQPCLKWLDKELLH